MNNFYIRTANHQERTIRQFIDANLAVVHEGNDAAQAALVKRIQDGGALSAVGSVLQEALVWEHAMRLVARFERSLNRKDVGELEAEMRRFREELVQFLVFQAPTNGQSTSPSVNLGERCEAVAASGVVKHLDTLLSLLPYCTG